MADASLIGQVGEVIIPVPGDGRPGEILAVSHGVREKFIAYADVAIDRGASVLVIAVRGPRQVDVLVLPS